MKNILIAIDYHPSAEKVAMYGHNMAKAFNADVCLLHVLADPVFYTSSMYDPIMGFGGYSDMDYTNSTITDSLERSSSVYLHNIKRFLKNDDINTLVRSGNCADVIIETAKEIEAEIIVMGSHSQKWLEHLIIGSQTEKVLKQITTPLYIIPTKN